MKNKCIVLRVQTGNRQVNADKQRAIDQSVVVHLWQTFKNIGETHFAINFDNGKTLGSVGEKQVRDADVVSCGEKMTMVLRLSSGASARISPHMVVFSNQDSSYPIRGIPGDIPGVWEERLDQQEGILAVLERAPCNSECHDELPKLKASLCTFLPNATDLCQPADSFVIAKFKDVWSRRWNAKKIELIDCGEWQNTPRKDGSWSGKLHNPGTMFSLLVAAETVSEMNAMRDSNSTGYPQKAVIRCGLSLGIDVSWSIK
ncbi:hypothetical protein PybrP1_001065 [[Pythium] brassicae (nom. inval.)]|nr:hypothetical protein PybrP1_001065 [[Pythium] brassicae (nom. inval.)]